MGIKDLTRADGTKFKLGRRRPVARGPRLKLANYLYRALPAPPASVDYSPDAMMFLQEVLANDRLGDCTAAGAFHAAGVMIANAMGYVPFSEQDVIRFYSATTGYDPADPSTDQGGDEVTVLNYWREKGLLGDGSHKISAWVAVNAADRIEVMTAMWLFENLYFGVELPDAWLDPMPSEDGFVWNVAGDPDPSNGHCFVGVGYDAAGVKIDTWGMIGTLAWPAVARYASTAGQGELYAVLGQDAITAGTGKAPNGFDWTQLAADMQAIG